ncbi:hypothetical protein X925_08850 [Petrotoga sp. 9T1HF07.CasAA.8.2]|nr:hypothetical protein X925_08850 [Petrotoga sp. 9T1HF07.CasAA.8.2]
MRLCAKSFFGINLNLGVLKGVSPFAVLCKKFFWDKFKFRGS